jgi:hypothetical protein
VLDLPARDLRPLADPFHGSSVRRGPKMQAAPATRGP